MPSSFPAVLISEASQGRQRASAAMRLTEITQLPLAPDGKPGEPLAHAAAVSFLRAINLWGSSILELRYGYHPDLGHPASGRTDVFVVLHEITAGKTARRDVLARIRTLSALLRTYFQHVVLDPVASEAELAAVLRPEIKGQGWALTRNRVRVDLRQVGPMNQAGSIGFRSGPPAAKRQPAGKGNVFDYVFPWLPSHDSWRTIADAMHAQNVPTYLTVRVRPCLEIAASLEATGRQLELCENFLRDHDNDDPLLKEQAANYRTSLLVRQADLRDCALDVTVTLTSSVPFDGSLAAVVGEALTEGVVGLSDRKDDRMSLISGGYDVVPVKFDDAMNPEYQAEGLPFTASEGACAFRFPFPAGDAQQNLPIKLYRTCTADMPSPAEGDLILGKNIDHGRAQTIGMPPKDRLRHAYVIGVTGSGKSTLLESMILQDIRAGHGVAFVDPHGETIDRLIGQIPRERIDDVLLVDPLDRERPIGFNLLRCANDYERDFFIGEMWNILDAAYDLREKGGPMFEQYMRGFMRILMGDDGKREARPFVPTLLELESVMTDTTVRDTLLAGCDPDGLRSFLRGIDRAGGEASLQNLVPYITSKFNRFVHDKAMARIVGQSANVVDFHDILRTRKIVLFKLAKGRFSGPVCDILSGMFVSRLMAATFARGEIAKDERTPYYLYVDEFQNLVSDSFGEMLAEVRKYGLGLTLAHQYTDQLTRSSHRINLLPAVLGNVGTIVSFRVGAVDAERLAPSYAPAFSADDLLNLPNYQAYVRTNVGGRFVRPFNLTTDEPSSRFSQKTAREVIERSRQRYGRPVAEVDAEIAARREWLADGAATSKDVTLDDITLDDLFK